MVSENAIADGKMQISTHGNSFIIATNFLIALQNRVLLALAKEVRGIYFFVTPEIEGLISSSRQ